MNIRGFWNFWYVWKVFKLNSKKSYFPFIFTGPLFLAYWTVENYIFLSFLPVFFSQFSVHCIILHDLREGFFTSSPSSLDLSKYGPLNCSFRFLCFCLLRSAQSQFQIGNGFQFFFHFHLNFSLSLSSNSYIWKI